MDSQKELKSEFTNSEIAKLEQEFENEQVRQMKRTGICPCCGHEQQTSWERHGDYS